MAELTNILGKSYGNADFQNFLLGKSYEKLKKNLRRTYEKVTKRLERFGTASLLFSV